MPYVSVSASRRINPTFGNEIAAERNGDYGPSSSAMENEGGD
jgi:hypothetical protein